MPPPSSFCDVIHYLARLTTLSVPAMETYLPVRERIVMSAPAIGPTLAPRSTKDPYLNACWEI